MTDQERHRLRAASNQLLIVAGMCAVSDGTRPKMTAKERGRADEALWRELAVLFGLCGLGW